MKIAEFTAPIYKAGLHTYPKDGQIICWSYEPNTQHWNCGEADLDPEDGLTIGNFSLAGHDFYWFPMPILEGTFILAQPDV